MSDYTTNGYLVSIMRNASEAVGDPAHGEAKTYLSKFRAMEDTFYSTVHTQVDWGLAIDEAAKKGEFINVYTIHGCRHVSDLIKSLDKLATEVDREMQTAITVLESYILLCAAHIHDAANTRGRAKHPENCGLELSEHKDLFDPIASQQVFEVARVHGGEDLEYGKDTFRAIKVDGSDPPRLLLLAALLRIGDELSENENRVPRHVAKGKNLSPHSMLAHAYARSFQNFEFKGESLSIVYGVYPTEHSLSVESNGTQTDFYDFLEKKIDVIERESRYCSQYARPFFNIREIKIVIRRYKGERPSTVDSEVKFTLSLNHGYPDECLSLCNRAPELNSKNISSLKECFERRESVSQDVGRALDSSQLPGAS